jgi:hypothetical protein
LSIVAVVAAVAVVVVHVVVQRPSWGCGPSHAVVFQKPLKHGGATRDRDATCIPYSAQSAKTYCTA